MQDHIHLERLCSCGIDGPLPMEATRPLGAMHDGARPQAYAPVVDRAETVDRLEEEGVRRIELREEQLVPRKELREVGEVTIRTEVEEIPRTLNVEALREEVEVEHIPVGQVVSERREPWEEGDALIVPVYEEQVVMTKRLVLREHLRVRRIATRETQHFEDTVRRERLVVEDAGNTQMIHERYPVDGTDERPDEDRRHERRVDGTEGGGFMEQMVRRVLQ